MSDLPFVYEGNANASASVAVGADTFVVANDEDSVLRFYSSGGAAPTSALDLSGYLAQVPDRPDLTDPEHPETDLEGAAMVGDVIYWISSHGRNSKGKERPARQRFFATEVVQGAGRPQLRPLGKPRTLLDGLLASPHLKQFGLGEAARVAPEEKGGLNIEGLAAWSGGRLLIGFRNPVPDDGALLVPLENPREVVEQGAAPALGEPLLVPLEVGGRRLGIRDITYLADASGFLIAAGPPDDGGPFAIFEWGGKGQAARRVARLDLGSLRPEGLVAYPGPGRGPSRIEVLSDDGGTAGAVTFRGLRFDWPV